MRVCNECGTKFSEGYIDDGVPVYYYCSERCLDKTYTPHEKVVLQDGNGLYWTTWEGGDNDD